MRILLIRLTGAAAISLVTLACIPLISTLRRLAAIPINVSIHEPRDAANKSVGEKTDPSPWLSLGASVRISALFSEWTQRVERSPSYQMSISAMAHPLYYPFYLKC